MAYDRLKEADYPFNLPFNLDCDRLTLYEKYLDIDAASLYKVFAQPCEPDIVAREYLELSAEAIAIIFVPAENVSARYGNLLSDSTSETGDMPAQIPIEDFIEVTGLTHATLRELLKGHLNQQEWQSKRQSEFFCNAGLGGFARYDEAEVNIVWAIATEADQTERIPPQWFDRVQRLIRLSQSIDISISNLDLIIRRCCGNELTLDSLRWIATVKKISTDFSLPIDETCALFSAMNNVGHGDSDLLDDNLPIDLFNRVLNRRFATLDHTYVGSAPQWTDDSQVFTRLTYTSDILALENKTYRHRIDQGLQISEKQLQAIVSGFRSRANENIEDEDHIDRLWTTDLEEIPMLSTLYRVSKLVDILETSVEDLFSLLDVLERDPAVQQLANQSIFIQGTVTERNGYKILRQEGAGSLTNELFWLVQSLISLTRWLNEQGLSAADLLKISTGRYQRTLKAASVLTEGAKRSMVDAAKAEKIARLNAVYVQLKPWLLNETSFVFNDIDSRLARIIYGQVVTQRMLVAKADARLVHDHPQAITTAAYAAIDQIDLITRDDFLGIGLAEKIADKIFSNLVLMGYLTVEGVLNQAALPVSASSFSLETDFDPLKAPVFGIIRSLYENHADVAIYPSDLNSLGLTKPQLDELYHNLIFNGFLSETGELLQSLTFDSAEYSDLLAVNSEVGEYADEVYALLKLANDKFQQTKITVGPAIFSDLPLSAVEIEDLIENLKFNEYIDEAAVLVSNTALIEIKPEALLLELRFYPHWRAILKTLQDHIERYRRQCYTFESEQFFAIAQQLVADWAFEAISKSYVQNGQITASNQDYFRNAENADTLDIAWPFEPTQNRVVFEKVRAIVALADQYRLTDAAFEAFKFDPSEINEVVETLVERGYLTDTRKLVTEHLPYFLDVNNALVFTVPAFEDYNKDIFFMLHNVARRVKQTQQAIASTHQSLVSGQKTALYETLREAFGLPAESIAAISKQIFTGSAAYVQDDWLVPILATVNIHDTVEREPNSSRFNTAYQRIEQFALLATKLKLSRDEIDIAFHDQNLTEKFPESIRLPTLKIGEREEQIVSFDALLESTSESTSKSTGESASGRIYLFKNADPASETDYARYWAYDSITHEPIETEDHKLSTWLTDDDTSSLRIARVEAAFVDRQGQDVIIADGRYYVKIKGKGGWVWQIQSREWGKVNSDFERLSVIDAAFTDEAGRTYLFANDQYLRYSQSISSVDNGYPKDIGESWLDEGANQALPAAFQASISAAFHGTDRKTYFFKDSQFVCPKTPELIQDTAAMWGKVKNNLKLSQPVDACYQAGAQYFVLSGDQVFAYRDCIENQDVLVQEGYPMTLLDHFGPGLPGEFHAGVNAAFKGEDGNIHLFKGERTAAIAPPSNTAQTSPTAPATVVNIRTLGRAVESNLKAGGTLASALAEAKAPLLWGHAENALGTTGAVDAALAGLDGRIYLFSDRQYYRYSYSDYSEVDSGYPRSVREDWGGLTSVHAAFVLDGSTYLFGAVSSQGGDSDEKMYVRYSTNDYQQPDEGYPRAQMETDDYWWNLPESIKDSHAFESVDAVLNALDGKTFLFSGNVFIYFDRAHGWWSEPQTLDSLWEETTFTAIDAAFAGKDGKTYLFSNGQYVRFSGDDYYRLDNGYPRPTHRLWGNVKHNIAERGVINAALVVTSREDEAQNDGTFDIVETQHTYLFSGDQFFRYSNANYSQVDPGYPKAMAALKEEPRFKSLEVTLENGIDAAFSDRRNIYLIKDGQIHASADKTCAKYPERSDAGEDTSNGAFEGVTCAVIDQGAIYVEKFYSTETETAIEGTPNEPAGTWYHLSSIESATSQQQPLTATEMPPLLADDDILPGYQQALDSVLKGRDGNTYLFKQDKFFNVGLKRELPIVNHWGRVRNNIQDRNEVNAGFIGRDGRTYVFSGDQYVVYDRNERNNPYVGQAVFADSAQTHAARSIAENWAGLTSVHLAYVAGDRTYLFEKPDHSGNFRYVRYSSTDYDRPDAGFPLIGTADIWKMPSQYRAQGWDTFAAIVIGNDNTMLFIKGQEFLQFNGTSKQWTHPKPLDLLWEGTHQDDELFESLTAAFVGADGTGYFFGDRCYVVYKAGEFSTRERIGEDWGILPSTFQANIDAAFVYQGAATYLFAGDRYIRYSNADYCHIDDGYPKAIAQHLRSEPGFENLPADFETRVGALNNSNMPTIISGVVANDRHIYVFMGDECYVSSRQQTATYNIDILGNQRNQLATTGAVDAAMVIDDKTYLFSGDQYVRYGEFGYDYVDSGYPKRIATSLLKDLSGQSETGGLAGEAITLPTKFQSNIDAALYKDGTIYLFKDEHFFDFFNKAASEAAGEAALGMSDTPVDARFGKAIATYWGQAQNRFVSENEDDFFTGSGPNPPIDGAFVDAMGRLHVFKGDQFIRYADTDQPFVETGYPKAIASTFRLPNAFSSATNEDDNEENPTATLTGAFTFEGHTYLIKNADYVRYLGSDYGHLPRFYPVTFTDCWGDWSDYRLSDLQLIARFKSLQNRSGGDHTLTDFLNVNQGYVKHPYAMLSDIFDWDVEEVKWLKRHHAFLPSAADYAPDYETQFNLELICRMADILALTAKMGIDAKGAYEDIWQKRYGSDLNPSRLDLSAAADKLLTLLSINNGNSPDLNVLTDEIHSKLNLLKRDALVSYSLFIDKRINDTRDLYEQLLIDTQMGSCAQTSRVKEAIAAVQLYLHRYFIDLETIDLKGTRDNDTKAVLKERWQWMRNYRIWEANRKVFLYPENYIRPELRDTKTPEFKTLEEDLLQGDLSEFNIAQAFNRYIDRYTEVSRLTISGGYVYDSIQNKNDKSLILFGYTKREPHQYYYRTATFLNGRSDSVSWQPWLSVNIQIDAKRVYPVYALNKIFVFWAKVEVRSSVGPNTQLNLKQEGDTFKSETDAVNESVLQIYYSYLNLNREWVPPQKVAYEITSNDTITDFSLDFRDDKPDNAAKDLDNISVNCSYTTERQIRLKTDSAGLVEPEAMKKLHGQSVYLKAANTHETYFIDEQRSTDLAYAKLLLPGDVLGANTKFKIVPFSFSKTVAIAFESISQPGHYLQYSGLFNGFFFNDRLFRSRFSISNSQVRISSNANLYSTGFIITKSAIGDGYSFRPFFSQNKILFFQGNADQANADRQTLVKIEPWDDLTTHTAKRQTAFHFITNRKEETSVFRFYPETHVASEVRRANPTASQSGIETFRSLFPAEQVKQVAMPVMLNEPNGEQALFWTCFDYKGGSFLCKPSSGQTVKFETETLRLPDTFGWPVSAALQADGRTYLFPSTGDRYAVDGQISTQSVEETWGKVNNKIQSSEKVDAAFVQTLNDKTTTILFCEDQYVAYSNSYDFIDESYPRQLANNTDGLPNWNRMDAAFQIKETRYFIRGGQYVTSDDLTNEQSVLDQLVTVGSPASAIRSVFTYGGALYTLNESNNLSREPSIAGLRNKLDALYTSSSSSNFSFTQVISAFFFETSTYLILQSPDAQGSASYVKYEGNNLPDGESIFVEGNDFYLLIDPGQGLDPYILRWAKDASVDTAHRLTITEAPGKDAHTFFYDGSHTFIISQRGQRNGVTLEYRKLAGLPSFESSESSEFSAPTLAWEAFNSNGLIRDLFNQMQGWHRIDRIHAGFVSPTGSIILISGDQYLRYTPLEMAKEIAKDTAERSPVLPYADSSYPKLLSNAAPEDELPNWTRIDAAFQGVDGIVRFFDNNNHVFASATNGDRPQDDPPFSQLRIKDTWGIVQNNLKDTGRVDAAFTMNQSAYVISGDQYYRYFVNRLNAPATALEMGYPKKLAGNFEGLPSFGENIAFAFALNGDGYVYYRGGQSYAEFDRSRKTSTLRPVPATWPRLASEPEYDAAYSKDGNLYLISGKTARKYSNPTAELIQTGSPKYDIIRLSSMTGSQLSQALFVGGIDGLMQRSKQEIDELPIFSLNPEVTGEAVIQADPTKISRENLPVSSHLEFKGANGLYYWELFYHAPSLIAQALNTAQKFEAAKRWYEYIFDPTEREDYWKFLPFLTVDVDALMQRLGHWQASETPLSASATALSDELAKFAPALAGHRGMTPEEAESLARNLPASGAPGSGLLWNAFTAFDSALSSLVPSEDQRAEVASAKEVLEMIRRLPIRYSLMLKDGLAQIKAYLDDPFDPHAIASLRRVAYRRTTVMAYIDNLLDWGDMLFRQYTHESINEARMLYMLAYDLLGKKPSSLGSRVLPSTRKYADLQFSGAELASNAYDFLFDVDGLREESRSLTHAGRVHESVGMPYFYVPENEQILDYWTRIDDRLHKIRHCLNIMGVKQPLPLFQPPIDPVAIVSAVASGGSVSAALAGLQVAVPHYRFTFMLNKTRELVGKLNQLGNDLLGALEKQDAEALSQLQNRQEGVILQLTEAIKTAQLSEAKENLASLIITQQRAEQQRDHYEALLAAGKLDEEQVQISLMSAASDVFFSIPALKILAAIAKALPNVKVGAPTTMGAALGGSTIGASLGFLAESGESIAEGLSMKGEASGIEAQYLRSEEDWRLQKEMAIKEIEQIAHQIEGAKWQIRVVEHELTVHEKERSHNQSVITFMTEKFSNQQLYQWMSSQLSALYFQTYKLAHDMAKSAEAAYRYERGVPESQVAFIGSAYWDSLRKGLLAGNRLGLDLDRMEKAYLDTHSRSFEITKTISLLELDPIAFLELKSKGVCEFHFTEEMFDYDFPGHYRRQIKTIAVTFSAGKDKTVNATLTQLRNKTVMEPDIKAAKYLMNPKGNQPLTIRNDWRPSQQIAVSQIDPYTENSMGMFELRFDDDRYLPFEGTGAVSSWRLALSGKRGSYSVNELADAQVELKYTARQGGEVFSNAVGGLLRPYETAVYFDLATMFPNEFFAFVNGETEEMSINVVREMFPNMLGSKILAVYSQFETEKDEQISIVMNEDSTLTLRSQKLLLTESLSIDARGETWRFRAKGKKLALVNMALVLVYKSVAF